MREIYCCYILIKFVESKMDSHVLQLQLESLNAGGRKLFEEGAVHAVLLHAPFPDVPMLERAAFSNVARVLREKGSSEVEVFHGFGELRDVPGMWLEHAWVYDKRTEQHRDVTTDTFSRAYGFRVESADDVDAARPVFMFTSISYSSTCIEK